MTEFKVGDKIRFKDDGNGNSGRWSLEVTAVGEKRLLYKDDRYPRDREWSASFSAVEHVPAPFFKVDRTYERRGTMGYVTFAVLAIIKETDGTGDRVACGLNGYGVFIHERTFDEWEEVGE